jgi:hypothetical protein
MSRARYLAGALLVVLANVADAQSGWEARVTAVPNPVPAGNCATMRVEPVDDHGYRHSTMSNGAALDFRKIGYESSDATNFVIRNDPSMWGGICAKPDAPSVSTTVTVTLPDGVKGQIKIFAIAKGQPPQPAVVYRPQAPLRLPNSPEYAPGFVPAGASRASVTRPPTTGATQPGKTGVPGAADLSMRTSGSSGSSSTTSTGSTVWPGVTAPTLALAGTYHVPSSTAVTTGTLSMNGTYHVPPAQAVTTSVLSMAGTYPPTIDSRTPTLTKKSSSPSTHTPQ